MKSFNNLVSVNPPNIENNGGFFGSSLSFKKGIELAIVLSICYVLSVYILFFLPVVIRLAIFVLLAGAGTIFCFFGVGGKDIIDAFMDKRAFDQNKKITIMRIPPPIDTEENVVSDKPYESPLKRTMKKFKKGEKQK